jgi:hypothetical protein
MVALVMELLFIDSLWCSVQIKLIRILRVHLLPPFCRNGWCQLGHTGEAAVIFLQTLDASDRGIVGLMSCFQAGRLQEI